MRDLSPDQTADKTANLSGLNSSAQAVSKYEKKVSGDVKVGCMRRIKDYTLLSQACKRAGKTRVYFKNKIERQEEGRAYYSMGVLYDNMQEYNQAVKYYKKFLALCQTINDANGIKTLNFIKIKVRH